MSGDDARRKPSSSKSHALRVASLPSSNQLHAFLTGTLPHKSCSRTLGPAVLSTAIIARSSSAPRLQTYKAEDEIAVNGTFRPFSLIQARLRYLFLAEIRRFWPPLRSLETLHDNLSFKQFDDFLQRLLNIRTPMPSPPRTPMGISRENSDLNST